MIGRTLGNNRITGRLGVSRIGVVYEAVQETTNQPVVLWLLNAQIANDPQFKRLLTHTANVAKGLSHPHLTRVFEYSSINNNTYFTTEFVGKGTLRGLITARINQRRSLSVAESVQFVNQLSTALSHIHQANQLYLQVRPETIQLRSVNNQLQPVLANLITATLLGRLPAQEGFQREQLPYLSPEQLQGTRLDPPTDIFSLGATLYEMLIGRPPHQPQSHNEALKMQLQGNVQPPSQLRADVPQYLDSIILKSLAPDPNNRFLSGTEFARALSNLQSGAAQPQPAPQQAPQTYITRHQDEQAAAPIPANMREVEPQAQTTYAQILVSDGSQLQQTVALDKPVFFIGREDNNDLVLSGDQVSRRHARIDRVRDGHYQLMDLESANGVFLERHRLTPNQPVSWSPGQIVQIGDLFLRLEVASATHNPRNGKQQAANAGEQPAIANAARSVNYSPNDQFQVEVLDPTLTLQSGQRSTVFIAITNLSNRHDTYGIEIQNLPANWYRLPADVQIGVQQKVTTQVLFQPDASAARTQIPTVTLIVRSRTQPNEMLALNLSTTVTSTAQQELGVDIRTRTIRANRPVQISLTNHSPHPNAITLAGNVLDGAGRVAFLPASMTLQGGETAMTTASVRGGRIGIPGFASLSPVQVTINASQDSAPIHETLEYNPVPHIPAWAFLTTFGTLGLCMLTLCSVILLGALGSGAGSTGNNNQQVTAIAGDATTTFNDFDNDGLIDDRELELGTSPTVADTDGDGLEDGFEVNQFNSDPLLSDTDEDNFGDLQERNAGTDPRNPDTDGDGLLDGNDPNPLVAPSAPDVTIIASTQSGDPPLTVEFSSVVNSGDVTSYAWDFNGDGNPDSTASGGVFRFEENGVYNVTLTINGESDNPPPPEVLPIVVGPTIFADFTAEPIIGQAPLTVAFTNATVPDTNVSYAWDFQNDGVVDSRSKNPSFVYQSPGTYTVILTVAQPGIEAVTAQNTIIVQAPPTATPPPTITPEPVVPDPIQITSVSAVADARVANWEVTLNATLSNPAATASWSITGGTLTEPRTAFGASTTVFFAESGIYTATVTASLGPDNQAMASADFEIPIEILLRPELGGDGFIRDMSDLTADPLPETTTRFIRLDNFNSATFSLDSPILTPSIVDSELVYSWSTSPAGQLSFAPNSTTPMDNPNVRQPTITVSEPSVYTINLGLNDGVSSGTLQLGVTDLVASFTCSNVTCTGGNCTVTFDNTSDDIYGAPPYQPQAVIVRSDWTFGGMTTRYTALDAMGALQNHVQASVPVAANQTLELTVFDTFGMSTTFSTQFSVTDDGMAPPTYSCTIP